MLIDVVQFMIVVELGIIVKVQPVDVQPGIIVKIQNVDAQHGIHAQTQNVAMHHAQHQIVVDIALVVGIGIRVIQQIVAVLVILDGLILQQN